MRLLLALLLLLGLAAAALTAVLARTYEGQLQAVAQDRLQKDLPLVRAGLDEYRLRDLRLLQLVATNADVISGADAHDGTALDKVLGPLRAQMSPAATILAVVDGGGQIIATDPFTDLNFANDQPVKDALQGRREVNPANSRNVQFLVRNQFPVLSVESAWPVRVGTRTAGAVVLINALGDNVFDAMLGPSHLQAVVAAPQQRAFLAGSSQLRQLNQQQKLPGLLDGLDQKGPAFRQPVSGGQAYYFLIESLPTQPVAVRLLLGISGSDVAALGATLRRELLGVALLSYALLAIIGWLLLRWLLRPVRQLRRGALAIREGASSAELPKHAPVEVRQVASVLSMLAAELASMLETERNQRGHAEAIIDSMAEGVVVSDVNRRVTLVNPVAKRLLGINGADSAAALPGDLIPLTPGGRQQLELADNSAIIKSRSAPIIGGDGRTTGYVTLLHDASQEAELDRLKSEFVGIVSHELRTPLTSIKGSVDLLLEDETGDLNPTQRRFLSTIRRSSDRLINLVNDLLDLSRLEAGRVQLDVHPVDTRHLVEDTVNGLANLFAAKKQAVRVTCDPRLPPVLADRQRMEQVLVNLLGNASKYTPEGGEVCVATRCHDDRVLIDVADTGPGLSEEDQQRVFEKFYRAGDSLTQQQQAGSGLGLAIARSLVELHGGALTVLSELGRGAMFRVSLPTYEEEE